MKKFLSSLILVLTVLIIAYPAFADECNLYTTENSSACWIDVDGICYNTASGYIGTDYIPINPNTAYTVYAELISSPGNTHGIRIAFYDANKSFISPRFGNTVAYAGEYVFNVTSPANAAYIRVSSGDQSVVGKTIIIQGTYTKDNIPTNLGQCSVCHAGQVSRQYESATGTVSQNGTPSPTNPIEPTFYQQGDMILRKVGDVADTYDATTGKITRRVGVKVFDGTEQIGMSGSAALQSYRFIPDASGWGGISNSGVVCSHFRAKNGTERGTCFLSGSKEFVMQMVTDTTMAGFRQFLAEQYNGGTPVTVYYVLETPVEETPASTTYCADTIKIATTAYNAARFNPVKTELNSAVATIRDIVTKTINQTAAIASLQADKQTRPEDACPAGKKCLLVETEENGVIVPHWFPIIEAPE